MIKREGGVRISQWYFIHLNEREVLFMWRKIGLIFSLTLIFLMVAVTQGMAQKFPAKD